MNSSRKALLKELSAAAFDPRKPGPLAAIVSCNDPTYLAKRAQEALRDAEQFTGVERWSRVRDAIGILAYSQTLVPKAP